MQKKYYPIKLFFWKRERKGPLDTPYRQHPAQRVNKQRRAQMSALWGIMLLVLGSAA